MKLISGNILYETGFQSGNITIKNNKIIKIEKQKTDEKPNFVGLIIPTFINVHTHIGDSFIRNLNQKLPKDIEKLVGPNGFKNKMLNSTNDNEIIREMMKTIFEMKKNGINHICDYRENGIKGVNQINQALKKEKIDLTLLSRPNENVYDKEEVHLLLQKSNGIGLSSISDWEYSDLEKISKDTKSQKKIFSIHVSERIREDIDLVLRLKPDFIIHMNKATIDDYEKVKNANIPIVICPRSNAFFKITPNYKFLKEVGNTFLIGTDNAMLNNFSIIDEINLILKSTSLFSFEDLLINSTYIARKVLNLRPVILGPDHLAEFIVLDEKTKRIIYNPINTL